MTPEARRRLLLPGPPVRPAVPGTQPIVPPPSLITLPRSIDWRNVGGKNYVTSVKYQGGAPTCIAFAQTAALESCVLRSGVVAPGTDLDLSEQSLISCNDRFPGGAAEFMANPGLPTEACYRYAPESSSCSAACGGWRDQTYRIGRHQYFRVPRSIDEFKAYLVHHGPIVTGMNVPLDFLDYPGGVYFPHPVTRDGRPNVLDGFHLVLVIGYDDAGQYFIAKNSWGTGWGEAGFFRIDYTQFKSGFVDFGQLNDAFSDCVGPANRPGTWSPWLPGWNNAPALRSLHAVNDANDSLQASRRTVGSI
jgi:hypothetical protein